jgi:hypothetical protein
VTGGEPTQDKPDVTFAAPVDPGTVSHSMSIRDLDGHLLEISEAKTTG